MNGKIEGLLKSESVSKLRAALGDSSVEVVEINGLYSSAKAFAISECISGGVHVIVLQGRDDAAGCVNDLYNIKGDGNVYFFPPSDVRTVRGSSKDLSAKVQRTAAISALRPKISSAFTSAPASSNILVTGSFLNDKLRCSSGELFLKL